MEWTNDDDLALRQFIDNMDSDTLRIKEKIKQILLNNRFIMKVLNNEEFDFCDSEPDDYFGMEENIRPCYALPETQTNVKNFICYSVNYRDLQRYNKFVKQLQVVFVILCDVKTIIDDEVTCGATRHDLLGALIQDQFNYSNYFGKKLMLVEDQESIVDSHYVCRTMVFEQLTDNNIVKSLDNVPRLANKEFVSAYGDSY